jgi:predicted RNA-binding Zn ribbon-like protein
MSKTAEKITSFQLIAGHAALDLVNTLDWRFRPGEPEELLKSYGAVLHFAEESDLLSSKQARRLLRATSGSDARRVLQESIELREALAQVFYAGLDGNIPDPAPIKTLERYFKAARAHQKLRWKRTGLAWKWPEIGSDPEIPLWLFASSAARLMFSDDARRVRDCNNPECRWLFLDTSKNHTRRWCDMRICGNRMKARRFKAQHKD